MKAPKRTVDEFFAKQNIVSEMSTGLHEEAGDEDRNDEPYVSGEDCDCCGDWQLGMRYDVHAFCQDKDGKKELINFVLCEDCMAAVFNPE